MSIKSAEYMLPGEILASRDKGSYAFIPVSPCFEWHSYHLPMGTDGLIAERIGQGMVERVGGIYFRTLSFGLDRYRTKEDLAAWGFNPEDKIFGMNFPDLPLTSEYSEKIEMIAAVGNRLKSVKSCGFKKAFLINNHGGFGQKQTLEEIAANCSDDKFSVEFVHTSRFLTYQSEKLKVGGHAGLSETHLVLAFCPELVDLNKIETGELNVRQSGILHSKPVIEAVYNPHSADRKTADGIRENILNNFEKHVRSLH